MTISIPSLPAEPLRLHSPFWLHAPLLSEVAAEPEETVVAVAEPEEWYTILLSTSLQAEQRLQLEPGEQAAVRRLQTEQAQHSVQLPLPAAVAVLRVTQVQAGR